MHSVVRLWLDDVRPAPDGWTWCRSTADAKVLMQAGPVEEMSLDHDLGMDAVVHHLSPAGQAALARHGDISGLTLSPEDDGILLLRAMEMLRTGDQHDNGYAFCCWMEETGRWPRTKPRVHSANPAGAARMRAVIDRAFAAAK
jgi:hypothetical protein